MASAVADTARPRVSSSVMVICRPPSGPIVNPSASPVRSRVSSSSSRSSPVTLSVTVAAPLSAASGMVSWNRAGAVKSVPAVAVPPAIARSTVTGSCCAPLLKVPVTVKATSPPASGSGFGDTVRMIRPEAASSSRITTRGDASLVLRSAPCGSLTVNRNSSRFSWRASERIGMRTVLLNSPGANVSRPAVRS